jgi:hypothetical protein
MIVQCEWVEIRKEVVVGHLDVPFPESPTEARKSRLNSSMGMTLNKTGKITNMGPKAYHYTNLVRMVVVKKSAFITLKLWTINEKRSEEVTI